MLVLLLAQVCLREALCVDSDDEGVLQVARTDFHAHENAWSVSFGDLPGHAFDLLVFELCRSHCSLVPEGTSRPQSCTSLAQSFQEPGWHNEYMASAGNGSARLCADMHTAPRQVQVAASHVLSDETGRALALVRAPLVLVLYNEDALVKRWMSQEQQDLLGVSVCVSYVTSLRTHFVLRRSVLRVQVRRPVRDVLTFGVLNPCTAAGFSAPELGSVTGVRTNGRLRCVWHCRADSIRVPYNAPPPTREQLNVSHAEYAQLRIKYACMQPPSAWTATVFVFSLETVSLPVESGVAQSLLNALDSMAETLRQRLLASGEGIVLLSVLNEFSHPVPFDEWTRNLRVSQCASNALSCSASSDLVNPRFLYGRRLLDATLDIVRVQGVLVAPLLPEASISSPAEQAQVANIRTVLETIAEAEQADASVLIRVVQDIDVQEVVVLDSKPAAEEADAELPGVTGPAAAAAVFFCLFFVLVFIAIVSFTRTPRLHECA